MRQPPRLLDSGTDFERELLGSARSDAGGDDGFKRAVVAMGAMGAGIATMATATTATASTTASGAAAGTSAGSATVLGGASLGGTGAAVVVKWVGVSVALVGLGGATASATSFVRSRLVIEAPASTEGPRPAIARAGPVAPSFPLASRSPIVAPGQPPAPLATATTWADRAASDLGVAPAPVAGAITTSLRDSTVRSQTWAPAAGAAPPPAPAVSAASVRATQSPAVIAATGPFTAGVRPSVAPVAAASSSRVESIRPSPPPPSLDAEVAALDRARASLASRDPAAALRELDAYDQTFPTSMLGDEALVLRIDALVASGDDNTAQTLSRRFLAAHPNSPHAAQLLRLLDHSHNP